MPSSPERIRLSRWRNPRMEQPCLYYIPRRQRRPAYRVKSTCRSRISHLRNRATPSVNRISSRSTISISKTRSAEPASHVGLGELRELARAEIFQGGEVAARASFLSFLCVSKIRLCPSPLLQSRGLYYSEIATHS